jgi:hypothetical protein
MAYVRTDLVHTMMQRDRLIKYHLFDSLIQLLDILILLKKLLLDSLILSVTVILIRFLRNQLFTIQAPQIRELLLWTWVHAHLYRHQPTGHMMELWIHKYPLNTWASAVNMALLFKRFDFWFFHSLFDILPWHLRMYGSVCRLPVLGLWCFSWLLCFFIFCFMFPDTACLSGVYAVVSQRFLFRLWARIKPFVNWLDALFFIHCWFSLQKENTNELVFVIFPHEMHLSKLDY